MSWKCDIVTDLAPLYEDGLASEASKRLIKEHLKKCHDCKAYYKKYRPAKQAEMDLPASDGRENFAVLAKRLRRRRLLLWLGFLSYVGATMGVWVLHRLQKEEC